jgi:hypothetical protein
VAEPQRVEHGGCDTFDQFDATGAADYRAFLERSFLLRPGRDAPVVQPRA